MPIEPLDRDKLSGTSSHPAHAGGALIRKIDEIIQVVNAPGSGTGSGDVSGPESSGEGNLCSYDGTTGKVIEDSGITASSVATHMGSSNNPHSTSVSNLGSGTIAELNSILTDAELDTATASRTPSGPAGGNLGGTYPNPDVVDLTISGQQQGDVLYHDGTNWVRLAAGAAGQVLQTNGAGQNPTWEDPSTVSSSSLKSQQFGSYQNSVPLRFRKGSGASTSAGTADISQLSAWIVPVDITLKHIEIVTFRSASSLTVPPVVGVYDGASGTPEVEVTMSSPTDLPDTGSYQVMSLGDTAVAAGTVLTVQQTAGTTLEFSSATVYYE